MLSGSPSGVIGYPNVVDSPAPTPECVAARPLGLGSSSAVSATASSVSPSSVSRHWCHTLSQSGAFVLWDLNLVPGRPEGAAHDLAGGGAGQPFQESHLARCFMCREPGADMVLKLDCQLSRRFRSRAQHHEGRRYMPPDLVKNAHDLPWEGRWCRRCRSDRQGPPLRS